MKRERALNKYEQNLLLDIIEDTESDEVTKVAANLLLDNQIAAERLYYKLDKGSQEKLKTFPIYKFWQKD